MNVYSKVSALLLILLVPSLALGDAREETLVRIERNKPSGDDSRFTTVGAFGLSKGKMGHIGLSYIETDNEGDALALDAGAGIAFHAGASFFVGAGLLFGYNGDASDVVGTYYPEAGVLVKFARSFGVIASRKHYADLYGRSEGISMFGLLFAYP